MKKFYLCKLCLVVFGALSACSLSTPTVFLETQLDSEVSKVSILDRPDGTYGAWTQTTEVDEFDGKSIKSKVLGNKEGSQLYVWSHKYSDSQISLHIGDNHICSALHR